MADVVTSIINLMKDLKLGLKLFSNQFEQYRDEAIRIVDEGYANYIELFVYPDSLETINDWKSLRKNYNIEFSIHSPHSSQNVNLVLAENFDYNKKIYSQMDIFMDELEADYMVVHSGRPLKNELMPKEPEKEVVRQLEKIKPKRMVIENTPYFSPKFPDIIGVGGTVEQIKYIKENLGCPFCFDIGHSFCSAVALNKDYYEYMDEFEKLEPYCYHFSDGEISNKIDKHFHIEKGDYDWQRILQSINPDKKITLETITKNYSKSLFDEFVNDTKILRNYAKNI